MTTRRSADGHSIALFVRALFIVVLSVLGGANAHAQRRHRRPRAPAVAAPAPTATATPAASATPPPPVASPANSAATPPASSSEAPPAAAPRAPSDPAALPSPAVGAAAYDDEDEASRRERARMHFQRGVEHIEQQRWRDAVEELQQARAIRPSGPVLFNLGLALRAVGRYGESIAAMREFLRLGGTALTETRAQQTREYINEMTASLATVELHVEPANATVRIDGDLVAADARRIELNPGVHTIEAEAPEHFSARRRVTLQRGGTAVIEFDLGARAVVGQLHVESNVADAEVLIDGRLAGAGTLDENVAPGLHTIEVRAPRRTTFRRQIDVLVGSNNRVRAVLGDRSTIFEHPAFWIITGSLIAGGAITAGVLLSGPEPAYRGSLGIVTEALRATPSPKPEAR